MRGIGIPPGATQPIFERAKGYVEAARAIMPGAQDVRMLDDLLTNAQWGTAARVKRNRPTNV